jgi:hypothetical protein
MERDQSCYLGGESKRGPGGVPRRVITLCACSVVVARWMDMVDSLIRRVQDGRNGWLSVDTQAHAIPTEA